MSGTLVQLARHYPDEPGSPRLLKQIYSVKAPINIEIPPQDRKTIYRRYQSQ